MQDAAAHHTAEAIVASAASKGMYTGAGITLGGWWTSNEFLGLTGLLIALLGFAVNWVYKHRLTAVEIRAIEAKEAREAEEHRLMCERYRREAAEHNARMGMYE